ncbi:MAG: FtsH protease activity modulator HflK [Thiomargarita sp.]|nr:FtsH protease activity modulator HflK [Thiomargarita sp.]
MAWNEPGGGDKDKNPWGNRKPEQGPPDLDEIVQKVGEKFDKIFGGGQKTGQNDDGGGGLSNASFGLILFIALAVWISSGFYIIEPAELGVVTRFGHYEKTTEQGLNWHLPAPIEQVQKVNVQQVRAVTHSALMLTKDENIVKIELVVQYRVKDAKDYLFKVADPDNTLLHATESALREIVGTSNMDAVLTSERTRVAAETEEIIKGIIDLYETGLIVTSVNMQNAQPPAAVQAAFADVIKAREDQERSKNKADAYANEVFERAGGLAGKLRQESQAYKAKVIAHADGETKRFLSVLREYEKAPIVTRQRIYLETMESILSKTSKIMVDLQGNNLVVLPLEKLLGATGTGEITPSGTSTPSQSTIPNRFSQTDRDNSRDRGGR